MSNRLEKAAQFAARNVMTVREALTFKAAIEAGKRCEMCSQPATVRTGDGHYYCALDRRVMRQRSLRAAMRAGA